MTDLPFWDDFARAEIDRMARELLPTDELLMRDNPVIRDIIVQNRRRKRAFKNVSLGHIERLMGTPFLFTEEEVFNVGEDFRSTSKLERDLLRNPQVIIEDIRARNTMLQEELKQLNKSIKKGVNIPEEQIKALQDEIAENKQMLEKHSEKTTYRRRLPKGVNPEDLVWKSEDVKTRHTERRRRYQQEFITEMEGQRHGGFDKRRAQYIKIWDSRKQRYKSIPKPKLKPPLTRVDLSGGKVRELTPEEIARQVVGEGTPKSYANLAAERIEGIRHKTYGFRVVVDDVEDIKLTRSVLSIVEKRPQFLVNVDKESGKAITKDFIKIGSKDVPAEVFRQAYRSLPPAKKQASAKILGRILGRAFVPLGIALTVYDVVSLLSWGVSKLEKEGM